MGDEGAIKPQKGGFALLMDDAGDSLPSEEESEPEEVVVQVNTKDKKRKKDDDDDEDLDAMLAALRSEYAGEAVPEDTGAGEKVEKKEKKKKVKGAEEDAGDLGFEVIDGEEVGGTVKTAAQKKKEKKD